MIKLSRKDLPICCMAQVMKLVDMVLEMIAENPSNLHARQELSINDTTMRPAGSMGITWMPVQNWNLEARQ